MDAAYNRGHGADQSADSGSRDAGAGSSSRQAIEGNQASYRQQIPSTTSSAVASSSQPPNAPAPSERPPRPMNAWLIFRNHQVKLMQDANPTERRAQGQLSKEIAELWRSAPVETKRAYETLAREKKEEHARLYPDYQYAPGNKGGAKAKRGGRRQTSTTSSTSRSTPRGSDSPSQPNLSLPDPTTASSTQSGPSPRMRASPQLGYHPYSGSGRSTSDSTLPPINTSYSSTNWQNTGSSSAVSPYYSQSWQSFESPAGSASSQQYQAPSSAPADYAASFSDHRRSLSDVRQSLGSSSYLNHLPQYSPTWPAASSLPPTSASTNEISSLSTASNQQQRATYGLQPFDDSLYRTSVPNTQPQSQSQSHHPTHSPYPSLSPHSNATYPSSHEHFREQQQHESSEPLSIPHRSTPTPTSSSSPYPPFDPHEQQQQHANPSHHGNDQQNEWQQQQFPVETHFHYEITLPPSAAPPPPSDSPYPPAPPSFE